MVELQIEQNPTMAIIQNIHQTLNVKSVILTASVISYQSM